MTRKRITIRGKRRVVYTTKAQAKRAKERAPGTQRIRKVKQGWVVSNK